MRDVGPLPVNELKLDPNNPRIPEAMRDEPQDVLLAHLFENDVLDELAASFLANGYFDNEPILVLPADQDGRRVVVEGNRRTATLMVLLQNEVAVEAGLSFDFGETPTMDQIAVLGLVPAFEVLDRAEVSAYLGYRHIGGLRQWPAEAKARFVAAEVVRAEAEGVSDPFYQVGRVLGSNARGVRSNFETLEILRFAQQELSFDTSTVRQKRFTVWGLLINNAQVRDFINYVGRPRDPAGVRAAISDISDHRLTFILEDLVPRGGGQAVLADSRSISNYAQVLQDSRARDVLKKFGDLSLASSVVKNDSVASQLENIARRLETLLVDSARLGADASALSAMKRVRDLAQTLDAVLTSKFSQ